MSEGGRSKYYGKYRGTVVSNIDPLQIGRIVCMVPDVLGPYPSSWCMPCLPFTGKQMGMWCLPQPGSGVWVEFEQGDADYPIWSGCWYGAAVEVPALALAAAPGISNIVLQTTLQNTLLLTDVPGGGILLKGRTGGFIAVTDAGITISAGPGLATITLAGPTVDINFTALTIT